MDSKRRDFFRNDGGKTATVAIGAAALVNMNSLSDELKALSKEMNGSSGW